MIDFDKYNAFLDNADMADFTEDDAVRLIFRYIFDELKTQSGQSPGLDEILTEMNAIIAETKKRNPDYPKVKKEGDSNE